MAIADVRLSYQPGYGKTSMVTENPDRVSSGTPAHPLAELIAAGVVTPARSRGLPPGGFRTATGVHVDVDEFLGQDRLAFSSR